MNVSITIFTVLIAMVLSAPVERRSPSDYTPEQMKKIQAVMKEHGEKLAELQKTWPAEIVEKLKALEADETITSPEELEKKVLELSDKLTPEQQKQLKDLGEWLKTETDKIKSEGASRFFRGASIWAGLGDKLHIKSH